MCNPGRLKVSIVPLTNILLKNNIKNESQLGHQEREPTLKEH